MNRTVVFCLLLFSACHVSSQDEKGLYQESNYYEVRLDTTINYLKVYHYKYDTSYVMWKLSLDSLDQANGSLAKIFFYNDEKEGPYETYNNGKLRSKKFYKAGKLDGEYIEFQDSGRVDIKGLYHMGKKVGIWEDYYSDGVIFKRVYYSNNGQFQKQEIYHRKKGKLARTEYVESREY